MCYIPWDIFKAKQSCFGVEAPRIPLAFIAEGSRPHATEWPQSLHNLAWEPLDCDICVTAIELPYLL